MSATWRPRLLLDVDGVLADFIGGALRVIYDVTGLEFEPSDITEFDFCKALELGRHDAAEVKREIGGRSGFARNLLPCAGAVDAVRAVSDLADVYFVTAPWNSNPTWTHDREAWLEHYFDAPHSRVIHCSCKHLVAGDVFVDDKASAVDAWAAENLGLALHWQTPHNRREPSRHGTKCSSWEQLIVAVASIPRADERERELSRPTPIEAGLAELANTASEEPSR